MTPYVLRRSPRNADTGPAADSRSPAVSRPVKWHGWTVPFTDRLVRKFRLPATGSAAGTPKVLTELRIDGRHQLPPLSSIAALPCRPGETGTGKTAVVTGCTYWWCPGRCNSRSVRR